MRFRNLHAEELEGSVDIPGLDDWLHKIGATDATILITAPAGSGKAAAVGRLAHRLGRDVVLANLMELFDNDDPPRQLENLLRLCASERNMVIYLDKLDKALIQASREGAPEVAARLEEWLGETHQRLLDDECTVVFTGRDAGAIPQNLVSRFDKALTA